MESWKLIFVIRRGKLSAPIWNCVALIYQISIKFEIENFRRQVVSFFLLIDISIHIK